jgi:Tfp pilus assembly protein PilN
MRAVNLLPADQRRGGSSPGRSGPAVYVVLGALAALVVFVGAYVLSANEVNSNRSQLAQAQQEAVSLEQQAAAFKPYHEFASLSQTRVQTVNQLADSRFDWERVMRELAQALPGDVWLTSLTGTVAPGVNLEGASGGAATGSLRSALPLPAVEMVGCTESQAAVSRVMARLRTLNGVQRVSLAASEKAESAGAVSNAGASSTDCRNGSSSFPKFQIVVFFTAPKSTPGAATAPGQDAVATQPTAAQPATAPTSTGGAK